MNVTASPLHFLAQATPLAGLPGGVPAGIGGAAVLRYTGEWGTDSIRVAGALTAAELMPGSVLGASVTADGNLDAKTPYGAKARMEFVTNFSAPSPALAGYLQLLDTHKGSIAKLESNLDVATMNDPTAALEVIRSLNKDEFIFGAIADGKNILWRGTMRELPAELADVVNGTEALYGTLA